RPPLPARFASTEQALFTVVVAAPAPAVADAGTSAGTALIGPDRHSAGEAPAGSPDGLLLTGSLTEQLAALGVQLDALSGGMLIATVRPAATAHDQARLAARAALLIKEHHPTLQVALSTGPGSLEKGTAMGKVVGRAASLLEAGPLSQGVRIDELS